MIIKYLKLLVLIIASDEFPGNPLPHPYKELQTIWQSYMHRDPEHVEAYFIRANPDLDSLYEIRGDVIWSQTRECVVPGILNKTILSLECMRPRFQEFDFILRTNLSSFYVFPKLLEFVQTLPKKGCYCGFGNGSFASGAGFLLSPDIAELLVDNKRSLFDHLENDDVAIGNFLTSREIPVLPAPRRDLLTLEEWNRDKDKIGPDEFHFRIKNPVQQKRMTDDLTIHSELLKRFYK